MSQEFVHLHVASALSMRYGTTTPQDLVNRASEYGQSALALTDRDTVAGAVSFIHACASAQISPILGVDIALETPQPYLPTPAHGGKWVKPERPRITLLAHDKQSWAGLCAIISRAHLDSREDPEINRQELLQLAGEHGLVALLGPRSDIGYNILNRRPDRALDHLRTWQDHGVRTYLEIATHRQSPDAANLSDTFAARMLQWAIVHKVPAVLTNMVRYREQQDSRIADVLDASRRQLALSAKTNSGPTNQAFLATTAHMHAIAQRISGMVGDQRDISRILLSQTVELGLECVIDPKADLGMNQVYVPELAKLLPGESRSADAILQERCELGFTNYLIDNSVTRVDDQRSSRARLDSELAIIAQMGLAGYVLTVAQVVDMIRQMKVRVAARGSGAGSFINHLLGISGVDPIAHNLLMERFVSTLRPGLPDIDIDVESDRRIEIYQAIFDRFGDKRTTCVSMRETYRVRHAIRDVGAALGMPPGEINTFAKSFPHIRARHVRSALAELPELRRSGIGIRAARGDLDQFLDLVEGLDGLPRHTSLHPCGIVLSDLSLLERTPVQPSAQEFPMSQFDKDDVEHMGLLKLDVLGVRMQSALAYAIKQVHKVEGPSAHGTDHTGLINLETVPRDDPKTFELIQSTKTLGCFQIESPGQRELIGKFAPVSFGDLITDISLFRPGPVKSDMITPFLRARQGWATTDYMHKDLAPILAETSGVVVFHEQVMRILSVMTDCSLEAADLIRRRMGDYEQLDEIREWFYSALRKKKYELVVIEQVWEVLRAFASFGFCKAHAAAFALPTYQSAWFKAHHPAAFIAGVLTHDPGMYPKRLIADDARSCGVEILGLDVNVSSDTYVVERTVNGGYGIRIPLSEVKGISQQEVSDIISAAPYRSLADFACRAKASRPIIERIVLAGGFDALHSQLVSRRDLLFHVAELSSQFKLKRTGRAVATAQITFGITEIDWIPEPTGLPALSLADRVRYEIEVLGIDVSAHIMSFYREMLTQLNAVPAGDLLQVRSQSNVLIAGVKVATQTPPIRSGKRVAFVTLEDSTGPVDATFFEEAQDQYAPTLFHSWLLLVSGTVRRTGPRGVSILANGCWELSEVYQHWKFGGVRAVQELIGVAPKVQLDPVAPTQIWEHASGFRSSPYADVRPAGNDIARAMRSAAKLAP
jgi:error-prone DNA polymerase